MSMTRRQRASRPARSSVSFLTLAAALALSALLTSMTLGNPQASWAVWLCLLPLMYAIRSLSPVRAALAGAWWGLGVWAAVLAGLGATTPPAANFFIVLPLLTAAYAGLGALSTRAIGFNPLVLAVGWILVEVALKPLQFSAGLLITGQNSGSLLETLARFLGYAFAATVVVGVNASLLKLLCSLRWRPAAEPLNRGLWPLESIELGPANPPVHRWAIRPAYPRGPPFSNLLTHDRG